jgi:hypothetical protein
MKIKPLFIVIAIFFYFLLYACPTIPAEKTASNWLGILPSDSSFYMYINHKKTNPLIKNILKNTGQSSADIEAILDRTQKSYLSVLLKSKSAPDISLILLGGYPTLYMDSILRESPDWTKIKNSYSYFQGKKMPLQVSLLKGYMILVSNGKIEKMFGNYQGSSIFPLAKDIDLDIETSDILLFFPLGLENEMADKLRIDWRKISIKEIWLTAQARENGYIFSGMFLVANDTGARLFSTIFKLTLVTLLRDIRVEGAGSRLKNVIVLVENNKVKITDFFLSSEELTDIITSIIKKPDKE